MSGIRVGSRLEQLLDLRRKIDLEIEVERRTHPPAPPARPKAAPSRTHRADSSRVDRLARLGVSSKQVKQWAVSQGLLPSVQRGRLADTVLDAYEQEHQ